MQNTYPIMRKWTIKQRHLQNFTPASGVCCLSCVQSSSEFVPLRDMLFQELVHSSGYKIPHKSKNVWVEVRLQRIKKTNIDLLFITAIYYLETRSGQIRRCRQKRTYILRLINNSLRLNKGNIDHDGDWISDLN